MVDLPFFRVWVSLPGEIETQAIRPRAVRQLNCVKAEPVVALKPIPDHGDRLFTHLSFGPSLASSFSSLSQTISIIMLL